MTQPQPDIGWFAPTISIEPVSGTAAPRVADVLKAELTLVANGMSGLSLTLNNQKFGTAASDNTVGGPVWPTWEYNQLGLAKFGQRLVFGVGYPDHPARMVTAMVRVTDIKFSFPNDGGAQLTVECKDLLSLLETTPERDKNYRDEDEADIVEDALARSHSGLTLGGPLVPRLQFGERLGRLVHSKSKTYYKLIEELAKRLDYELFVDGTEVHFEPARSLHNEPIRNLVELRWGRDLLSFAPTLVVWEQYTGAYCTGRRGRGRARVREAVVGRDVVLDDLPQEREAEGLLTATAVRAELIDDQVASARGDSPAVNVHKTEVTNVDDARARQWAVAELREQARKLLTVQVETIGRPELRPGKHIVIRGMNEPFDGVYYVTRAVHSFGNGGYRTTLSLRRPGIFDPRATAEATETEQATP
jgi:phage protein D